jgi:pilus assembly protein Flp/PilA
MHRNVMNFLGESRGATAIEYGLIAGLISVVIIAAVTLLGTDILGVFDTLAAATPGGGA